MIYSFLEVVVFSTLGNGDLKFPSFPPIFHWPIEGEMKRSALLFRNVPEERLYQTRLEAE